LAAIDLTTTLDYVATLAPPAGAFPIVRRSLIPLQLERGMGRAFLRRCRAVPWAAGLPVIAPLLIGACSGDPYPQSTLHPTADAGSAIDALYRQIFWWAVLVFVVVQTALVVTLIRFRKRPGAGEPRQIHGNTLVEITWTLAPAAIIVAIAPAYALQVEVVGHQWWWEYRYPALGIVTANELHLPQGRPVALAITSADVIHSFWAPKLHGKRDAMPGRTEIAGRPSRRR
jgi:cytochrome c oxidase subunit 2